MDMRVDCNLPCFMTAKASAAIDVNFIFRVCKFSAALEEWFSKVKSALVEDV